MRSARPIPWWWSRLRAMSAAEVGWRVGAHVRAAWESRAAGRETYRPLPSPRGQALRSALRESTRHILPDAAWRAELTTRHGASARRLEERARRIVSGEIPLFAEWVATGPRPDWHVDPGHGTALPRRAAARLDYRDALLVGDARRVWELHRHHHLSEVALAGWVTRDTRRADFAVSELARWCDDNPPLVGIGWASSLELAIRTLSWAQILAVALELEAPALTDEVLERLVGAWVRQVRHVRAHDSRYSSANNHRIGEAAAVATAGALLPFHRESEAWWRWGCDVLQEEILLQIHTDGVSKEQAFGYQRFVLDFAFWVWALARRRGEEFSPAVYQRLERAAAFLAWVSRPDGTVFPVGDDDEGRVVSFGEDYEERTRATLEVAARLFGRPEWSSPECARGAWLALPEVASPAGEPAASQLVLRRFPEGGYVVVRGGGGEKAPRLLFDAGPLGFGRLAAHGHADALSVALWAGEDLLADAGTGSYHGLPEWREALRGTGAHNTVSVDDRDSSERLGLFLWGRRAEGKLLAAGSDGDWFVVAGAHDGYRGRSVPVTRRIVLGAELAGDWVLLVLDELYGSGRHRLRVPWHAAAGGSSLVAAAGGPLWQVRYASGWHLLGRAAVLAAEETPGDSAGVSSGVGIREEEAGRSTRFGDRGAQTRCVLEGEFALPAAAVWLLHLTRDETAAVRGGAPAMRPTHGGLALSLEGAGGTSWRGLVTHPSEAAVEEQGVRLDGRAAAWVESGPAGLAGRAVVAGAQRLASGLFTWTSGDEPLTGVLRSRPEARSFAGGGEERETER